jgi:hypothetical protein
MNPPLAVLLPYLLAIVALALLLVYVMVQWSRAMVSLPALRLPAAGDPRRTPAVRWTLAYAAVLGALAGAYLVLFRHLGSGSLRRNLLLLLLVVGSWLAVNLLLVLFIRALARAQGGQPSRQESPHPRPLSRERERGAKQRLRSSEGGGLFTPLPLAGEGPGVRARLLNALRTARNLLLALLVIAIGEALPPLQRLDAWTQAHRQPLLAVTLSLTGVGFILLMGMAIHLVLARGKPMSRREIDELAARRLTSQPALWRRSVHRSRGLAVGAQGEDSASFAEIKAAWRARAWQVSPRWRRLFAGLLGTAFLATGLFGLFVVIGPPGIKLLCGSVLLYAWIRSISAFLRA